MLVLTKNATAAIDSIVSQPDVPDGAGLRISLADGADQLAVTVAPAETADRVVDGEGTRVFLDSGAAEALDDKVLDAQVSDGNVRFLVAPQAS